MKPDPKPNEGDLETANALYFRDWPATVEILTAYRVEVEARARREGAKEVLEKAAASYCMLCADGDKPYPDSSGSLWVHQGRGDCPAYGIHAIRALAEDGL